MLTAVGKAGLKTAFIGKVGDDMHGNFLVETAKQAGIDTRGIVVDNTVFTTLAFVTLDENGERESLICQKAGSGHNALLQGSGCRPAKRHKGVPYRFAVSHG